MKNILMQTTIDNKIVSSLLYKVLHQLFIIRKIISISKIKMLEMIVIIRKHKKFISKK
jgi:hypothetical protein